MKNTFYQSIPAWMVSTVSNTPCTECGCTITKHDISGIALKQNTTGRSSVHIEYICPECHFGARMDFGTYKNGTIEEMCYLLLDEVHKRKTLIKSRGMEKSKSKGPIQEDEVQEFIKNMNKSETFDEFLVLLKANKLTDES